MSARFLVSLVFASLYACGGGSSAVNGGAGTLDEPVPVANQAPVADIQTSGSVQEGHLVTLDGTASLDPDGRIRSYAWAQVSGPPVQLAPGAGAVARFTAPAVRQPTALRFHLEVLDDEGARAGAEVDVTVRPGRYALSGTIFAASGMAADGDVNDPGARPSPNDTPATAQRIANPVTVGGYAGTAGAGAAGALQPRGDAHDFYSVYLRPGQSVTLFIAEPAQADLDLYVWDEAGVELADASTDTGELESVKVGQGGRYLLEVVAYSGASSYTLVSGHQPIPGIQSGLRLAADFVPGEIIVERAPAATEVRDREIAPTQFRAGEPTAGGPVLVRLQDVSYGSRARSLGPTPDVARASAASDDARRLKLETLLAIKALRQDPSVRYAQPNYRVRTRSIPNDPFYPLQWHYPMIDLPAAWELGDGSGTTVAVLDTGVLLDHPDLAGQLVPGYDFVSSVSNGGDGDGIDADPTDPGPGEASDAAPFHGTHVAGTVAAAAGNGMGTSGVAPGARIMPVRVLSAVGGSSYDILQGVRYAAGLANDSGTVVAPADVINLSLGRTGRCWPAEQAAFDAARQAGVVVVAAAGNDAMDAANAFPANCNHVLAVGAVGPDGQRAAYSNFGALVDLQAPGGVSSDRDGDGYRDGVLSLMGELEPGGAMQHTYAFRYGTSMASPHVAGVVALMKSVNPTLTPQVLDTLVEAGELNGPGGVVNAYGSLFAALNATGRAPETEAPLAVAPDALNFGAAYNHAELELRGALDPRLATTASVNEAWLRVVAAPDAGGPAQRFTVTVDRRGLAAGTHSDVITIVHGGRRVEVPVIVQVTTSWMAADAGHLYVLLLDADSGAVAAQTGVTAANGSYTYELTAIARGRYRLVAGSDVDNDGYICDPGESCGVYQGPDGAEILLVDGSESGADFSAGRLVSLTHGSPLAGQAVARITGAGDKRVR